MTPTQTTDPIVKRIPFFYGWVMVPVAMITAIVTSPGQTFGISVFNPSFRAELSLSHSLLTGAYMLGTFIASFPQSYFGSLMDKWGIRKTAVVMTFFFGCACLLASQVRNLYMLFFAFLFLRMFGQGALSLLSSNTLAMWFNTRLGRVSGVMSVGIALAIGTLPGLFLKLIKAVGWRWAYATLGLLVWAIMYPMLATVFRNRPEDVGQVQDGVPVETAVSQPSIKMAYTLKEAFRTRAYWVTLSLMVCYSMIVTGVTFNILPLFESRGLTPELATASFASMATALAISQIVGGYLADRLPLNWLACTSALFLLTSMAILMQLGSAVTAHGFTIMMGTGQGLLGAVISTLWVRYYGRLHLGKIRGSTATAGVAASSIGPFLMGATFDWTGSYQTSIWIFVAVLIPVVVATLFATPPQREAGE